MWKLNARINEYWACYGVKATAQGEIRQDGGAIELSASLAQQRTRNINCSGVTFSSFA